MKPIKASRKPLMSINIPEFQYPIRDNRNFALQKIKFVVNPLDSIAILGESGSGKSTILKILAGLLKSKIKEQVCMLSPHDSLVPLLDITRKKRYRRLQIVFQDNMGSLYEKETVQAALKHIARITGQKKRTVDSFAKDFFQQLRLISDDSNENDSHLDSFDSFKNKQVVQLSMGMLRRFCLVKALLLLNIYDDHQAHIPKILLLDEISRGLDNSTKEQLVQFIQNVQATYQLSIVAISHDLNFLKSFCNQFYFLFEGLQIPKVYKRDELSIDACEKIGNTYLRRYFIPCEEPVRRSQQMVLPENSCYFQQFYHCPDASGCQNVKKENPWICV